MPIIDISGLSATIGARLLFAGVSARLDHRAHAALIGPNGVGKSTLLAAVASACGLAPESEVAVSGAIRIARGAHAAYLPQEPGGSSDLSAGQRVRAALGRILAQAPDLLLLDEPTNHLDVMALGDVETELAAFPGALLVVSHDRVFLDAVAEEIWELSPPRRERDRSGRVREAEGTALRTYRGDYSAYRRQLDLAETTQATAYAGFARQRRHLHEAAERRRQWADRAYGAASVRDPSAQKKAAKAAGRAKAADHRLRRLEAQAPEKPWERDPVGLPVRGAAFGGRVLLEASDLAVGPAGSPVLACAGRFALAPRARVALVGPNGAGKTTLLRTLAGELAPLGGSLWRSPGLRVAYVRQRRDDLAPDASAVDLLARAGGQASGRQAAAAVGLRGDRALAPVRDLSGGERTAVALALALMADANLLLLDEPTNHLDLWLREAVEAALRDFPGAFVVATHDRWLLQHLASVVWRADGGRLAVEGAVE